MRPVVAWLAAATATQTCAAAAGNENIESDFGGQVLDEAVSNVLNDAAPMDPEANRPTLTLVADLVGDDVIHNAWYMNEESSQYWEVQDNEGYVYADGKVTFEDPEPYRQLFATNITQRAVSDHALQVEKAGNVTRLDIDSETAISLKASGDYTYYSVAVPWGMELIAEVVPYTTDLSEMSKPTMQILLRVGDLPGFWSRDAANTGVTPKAALSMAQLQNCDVNSDAVFVGISTAGGKDQKATLYLKSSSRRITGAQFHAEGHLSSGQFAYFAAMVPFGSSMTTKVDKLGKGNPSLTQYWRLGGLPDKHYDLKSKDSPPHHLDASNCWKEQPMAVCVGVYNGNYLLGTNFTIDVTIEDESKLAEDGDTSLSCSSHDDRSRARLAGWLSYDSYSTPDWQPVNVTNSLRYLDQCYDFKLTERIVTPCSCLLCFCFNRSYPNIVFLESDSLEATVMSQEGTVPTHVFDLLTDIDFLSSPFVVGNVTYGNVHSGFLDAYDARLNSTLTYLTDKNKNTEPKSRDLYLVGHSLGAATTVLSAVELSHMVERGDLPWVKTINVYTFGCPPIGDKEFVAAYQHFLFKGIIKHSGRYVNTQTSVNPLADPVAVMHLSNFHHVHRPVFINGNSRSPWPSFQVHLIKTYLKGLNAALPKEEKQVECDKKLHHVAEQKMDGSGDTGDEPGDGVDNDDEFQLFMYLLLGVGVVAVAGGFVFRERFFGSSGASTTGSASEDDHGEHSNLLPTRRRELTSSLLQHQEEDGVFVDAAVDDAPTQIRSVSRTHSPDDVPVAPPVL
eukprot:Clim_evm136s210 gene=Clim_evmTU136s210